MMTEPIRLGGGPLTVPSVLAVVDGGARVEVDPAAWPRVEASHAAMLAAIERRPVYGRTTGVGANLAVAVDEGAGQRLLRSHTGGAGAFLDGRPARAMMVVRANQLLAGAAGVAPALIEALVAAIESGAYPPDSRVRLDRHGRPHCIGLARADPDRRTAVAR